MKTGSNLPETGFVRLARMIAPYGPIPLSKSTVYAFMKVGKYPKNVRLSPGVSAWRWEDVRAYINNHNGAEAQDD